jgi:Putative Ig domain.
MAFLGLGVVRVVADHPDTTVFQAYGYLRTTGGDPIEGVSVVGDNYIGDTYPSVTDADGYYQIIFPTDGNYRVTVDCDQLTTLGYTCPDPVGTAQEGDPVEIDFTVEVLNATLQIANTALPVGNVGMPYSVQLHAEGGVAPYQWSLASGSAALPSGLSLNSDGLVSGTPTLFSAGNIKVQVTDSNDGTVEKTFPLVINPRPMLTPISWITNRFMMRLSGAPRQNYTLQYALEPLSSNWTTLFTTNNPDTGTFVIRDSSATNAHRFYRVIIGP